MSKLKGFRGIEDHYMLAALLQISNDALVSAVVLMSHNMRQDDKYLNMISKCNRTISEVRCEMDNRLFDKFGDENNADKLKGIYYSKFNNKTKKEMAKKFLEKEGFIYE